MPNNFHSVYSKVAAAMILSSFTANQYISPYPNENVLNYASNGSFY